MHENNSFNKNIKLHQEILEEANKSSHLNLFGSWIDNIDALKEQYNNSQPFSNIVIDDFLNIEYAEKLHDNFPNPDNTWHTYDNPIEVKYAYDNINILPKDLKNYFYVLSSNKIVDIFKYITGIDDLTYDEYLHGAGLHCHPRDGRLNIHLDYEKHPYSGKERRINIIYFISKEWDPLWNGSNQLWSEDHQQCIKKTDVKFNRAIIFKTNDISWHGVPDKIICPENKFRKSLAYYYVSPLNSIKNENDYRRKAKFVKRPQDPYNENMEKLYKIRENRLITKEDMSTLFPNWKKDE
jgi:Rps23 Pro-64 3,4-dihydroxylase Tpa1-like proline 4-hydroxylase